METDSIVALYQEMMNCRRDAIHAELARSIPVNWNDAPLRQTVRPGLASVSIAADFDPDLWGTSSSVLDSERLAQVLLAAHGILRCKLDPNWDRSAAEVMTKSPLFARGTSSGGGLYPTEIYVAASEITGLPDGVYHYSEAHSALVRIRMGHFSRAVHEGLFAAPSYLKSFLILSLRFWKNSFKYHSFGYQLMLQDVGACAATVVAACSELGLRAEVFHQFDDHRIGSLIGATEQQEAPALIVGLSSTKSTITPFNFREEPPSTRVTEIKARSLERSTAVSIPRLVLELHNATKQNWPLANHSEHNCERTDGNQPPAAGTQSLFLETSLPLVLRSRESCWGRFRSFPAMQPQTLIKAMQFASADVTLGSTGAEASWVRTCVLALRVNDLPQAAYEYNEKSSQLTKISDWSGTPELLQSLYWMPNYNLNQVAAVIAIVGATTAALEAWGERSIRTINVAAGALAQRLYLACSALSLGCGVVFGFNVAMASALFHLTPKSEHPLLLAFVGPRIPSAAAYDFRVSGTTSRDPAKADLEVHSRSSHASAEY